MTNMNVLDTVIEQTVAAAATINKTPAMNTNDAITMALTGGKYMRGAANAVDGRDSIDIMLAKNKMDWRVCEMPVAVVGRRETRIDNDYKALVRSDNGMTLDVVSPKYQPFQNRDVFGMFMSAADAMGGNLVSTSVLDGGRFLSATVNLNKAGRVDGKNYGHDFTTGAAGRGGNKVGDIVGLTVVVTTGHKAGTAFRMRGQAFRMVCSNGVTVSAGKMAAIAMAHNRKWTASDTERVKSAIAEYLSGFDSFMENANRLSATRITRDMYKAYFLELFNPETLTKAREDAERVISTAVTGGVRNQLSVGRVVLDNILADTDKYFEGMGRTAKRVVDVVRTQPGHNLSDGTMWDAYNAVTYYVDHEQGRDQGAAVLSALMGDGDRLKTRALDLAIEYTQRIQGTVN